MTVVVADTSPLNYLILIQTIDVLPRLYGVVVVPRQVLAELVDPAAPDAVRTWASDPPQWIDARDAAIGDGEMAHLDLGERAALARLLETNFRVSTDLVSDLLAEETERRPGQE